MTNCGQRPMVRQVNVFVEMSVSSSPAAARWIPLRQRSRFSNLSKRMHKMHVASLESDSVSHSCSILASHEWDPLTKSRRISWSSHRGNLPLSKRLLISDEAGLDGTGWNGSAQRIEHCWSPSICAQSIVFATIRSAWLQRVQRHRHTLSGALRDSLATLWSLPQWLWVPVGQPRWWYFDESGVASLGGDCGGVHGQNEGWSL